MSSGDPATPFGISREASASFGMRQRRRIARQLLRDRLNSWLATIVVTILVTCAGVAAFSSIQFSNDPTIERPW